MSKKLFRLNLEKMKKMIAAVLVVILAVGMVPQVQVFAEVSDEFVQANEINLTEDQFAAFQALNEFNHFTGLVGFEDELALPNDNTQVSVIVFFESNPAPTQVIEAAMSGDALSIEEAEQIVEDEHAAFRSELNNLFGFGGAGRMAASDNFHISVEYRHALNGVAMTLPANMVENVAEFNVVRAIFPDRPVYHPHPEDEMDEEAALDALMAFAEASGFNGTIVDNLDNAWGNFQGRTRMNAHELHRRGYTGEGIIVAVLDTGVDWMHPTFEGSFPRAETIDAARMARFGPGGTAANAGSNPALFAPLTQGELFNINVYTHGPEALDSEDPRHMPWATTVEYRAALLNMIAHPVTGGTPDYFFLGRDLMRLWPEGGGVCLRANPIRPGIVNEVQPNGDPFKYLYPQTLPAGMPGNNPFEFSPLWHTNEHNVNMLLTHGLRDNGNGTGAAIYNSNHGTHVAGTILGRPFGDPGRTLMGVAPAAYGIHYRVIWGSGGSSLDSVIIAGQEWAFLDGANVVNMSLGGMLTGSVCVRSLSVNNIMLADPTIVFTISAGNSGTNFFQIGNPGGASMAVTVAWLTELFTMGYVIDSPGFAGVSTTNFTTARDLGRVSLVDGNFIFNHPNANPVHNNGNYTVFAMPETGAPHATPVGQGTVADFAALAAEQGEDFDLTGSFVLVRRGQTAADLIARAHALGIAGVILVPNEGQGLLGQTGAAQGNGAQHWNINAIVIEMTNSAGVQWATNMVNGTGYSTFRFTGDININGGLNGISGSSSRGPIDRHTFEIKPEIGTHGGVVHSANARSVGNTTFAWVQNDWQQTVTGMSGTSMAAPHAAGAVALLQQYSRDNNLGSAKLDGMWANYEIKARMTNTAIQLTGNLSPFDGGRQVDVWAATQSNTVVEVEFNKVAIDPFVPFTQQAHGVTRTGSFSFGGFNRHESHNGNNPGAPAMFGERNIGERAGRYSLRAFIHNNSNSAIIYTISSEMLNTARAGRPAANTATARITGAELATLEHVSTLTVPAGQTRHFDVMMNIPAGSTLGFQEGFVTVRGGSHDIILPVAAVMHAQQDTFTFGGLYRNVVTTNTVEEGAQNHTSNELVMYFSHGWGHYLDFYLIHGDIVNAVGFTGDNWLEATLGIDGRHHFRFADYIMGTTVGTSGHQLHGRSFFAARGLNPEGQPAQMRGIIFDGYYWPHIWQTMTVPEGEDRRTSRRLTEEGDFFIGINVFRQSQVAGTGNANWFWDESYLVPFSVDNTAPEFRAITINDFVVDLNQPELPILPPEPMMMFDGIQQYAGSDDIVITGNVFDEWLAQESQTSGRQNFGVWNHRIYGDGEINLSGRLGLWALAGENTEGNRPVQAEILPNGDFNVTLEGALAGNITNLRLWLIDGYAPVPVVNQAPIGQLGTGNTVPASRVLTNVAQYFMPNGFVRATSDVEALLRTDRIFGVNPGANINHFAWAGLNVTEFTIILNREGAVNTALLLSAIAQAEELNQEDFTPRSWAEVMRALASARTIVINPDATQAQINDAADRILDAINNLEEVEVPEVIIKDALIAAITTAENLVQADYTPQTWMQVMRAIATARAILGNPGATQGDIDFATANLLTAINGLIPRP